MDYEQPPDHRIDTAAGVPPGWYLDPEGLQALRWWGGTQWGPYMQPQPGVMQESRPPCSDATASASGEYDAFWQERVGWRWGQTGLEDGTAYASDLVPGQSHASVLSAGPQGQPEKGQQRDPQGWLNQPPYSEPAPQPSFNGYSPSAGIQQSVNDAHPALGGGRHGSPRKRSRFGRRALIAGGTFIVLMAVLAAAGVAGSHKRNASLSSAGTVQAPASARPSAASVAPSQASSPPSCASQLSAWRDSGAASQLQAIGTDLGNVSQAATSLGSDLSSGSDASADEATLQSASASLQSDAQAAEGNLIPDCMAGGSQAERAGLTDFSTSAADCQNAVGQITNGAYPVAKADMQAANAEMQSGTTEIGKATDALKAYSSSGT
jgi:hypothetical protein